MVLEERVPDAASRNDRNVGGGKLQKGEPTQT